MFKQSERSKWEKQTLSVNVSEESEKKQALTVFAEMNVSETNVQSAWEIVLLELIQAI